MLVQASGLVKQYPRVRALDQVSLEIKEGEVFGLFGPNGAGKTTCLRVLSGLTQPDQGSAVVCGVDVATAPNEGA
jgi:ABC-type multidrug transport system ATPase subunit